MDQVVELYWSFRSPYSYVVLPRIPALADAAAWSPRALDPARVVRPGRSPCGQYGSR